MTLREAINKYQLEVIRIGVVNGFIYVSKCTAKTPNVIERLSNKEHNRLITNLRKNREHANNLDTDWDKRARQRLKNIITNEKYEKIMSKLAKEREKIEREKKRDLKQTENNIKRLTKRLEEFIPFLDREVKEIYKSDINDDIIIIFEGQENGDYWTQEEYKRGVKGANK